MRLQVRFGRPLSWYEAHAGPRASRSRRIVTLDVRVMREVARSELPSTRADTICARFAVVSLFMSELCLSAHALSSKILCFSAFYSHDSGKRKPHTYEVSTLHFRFFPFLFPAYKYCRTNHLNNYTLQALVPIILYNHS